MLVLVAILKNSFQVIKDSMHLAINESTAIDLIDLNACDEDLKIDFDINHNIELYINITVLNFMQFKKNIQVNVFLKHADALCKINLNCLGLNHSITNLSVNAIGEVSMTGSVDIKIEGIIDSDNAKIVGSPNFIFKTNKIDAHHSLIIGGVNPHQIEFLESRQINEKDAKYLLITSKLFQCLNNLNEDLKLEYQNKILSYLEG